MIRLINLNNFIYSYLNRLNKISRKIVLIFIDSFLIFIGSFITFFLLSPNSLNLLIVVPTYILINIFLFNLTGHYKAITRYVSSRFLYELSIRNLLSVFLLLYFCTILNLSNINLKFALTLWLVNTPLIGFIKIGLRDFLLIQNRKEKKINNKNVVIYGAGIKGAQLANSLLLKGNHKILFFIDDEKNLWGRSIKGINIYPPNYLNQNINKIDTVLLSIPNLKKSKKRKIVDFIHNFNLSVMEIPSMEEITTGETKIDQYKQINIKDLLGRDEVFADQNLLRSSIDGAVVLVTGAGGSIGSQLSRNIIELNPKKLILLERCESNLFEIHKELSNNNFSFKLKPKLGDCCNEKLMDDIFKKNNIDIVFHAAAYKHVPMIEFNPLQGIYNNVKSTIEVCKNSQKYSAKKVILISSDKAVRPTNVMGASKRLTELIFDSFSRNTIFSKKRMGKNNLNSTCFSIVRFGNVMGSSGSVVPSFQRQIKNGGPITITHPEIIRYFMTIEEASQLVIQTSSLAKGGEVFLLDMGEPILIKDLAKKMITLSGLKLKDKENNNGDIEIEYIGLREGEKLFEELLIDSKSEKTIHPLIYFANEPKLTLDDKKFWEKINQLETASYDQDSTLSLKILKELIPEWESQKFHEVTN